MLAIILLVVFSSVGSDFDLAVIYWLFYCIGCGLIINYENSENHFQLALLSLPSPIILLAATYYRALFRGVDGCYLSGLECALDMEFVAKSIFFLFASIFFIWISTYLSDWFIKLIIKIFSLTPKQAKAIQNRVVWIGSFLVAVIGVITIFAHGWKV